MAQIRITQARFFASIQDLGRKQVQHMGLAQGGVADELRFFLANRLAQNPMDTPAIEIANGFFELQVDVPVSFGLAGGDLGAHIDGAPLPAFSSFTLNPGQTLGFSGPSGNGVYAYLSVHGGLDLPLCFGSASTVSREGLGGLTGQGLKSGDCLSTCLDAPVCAPGTDAEKIRAEYWPDFSKPLILGLMPGYDVDAFATSSVDALLSTPYRVTDKMDRTGIRLEGPAAPWGQDDVLSKPVALGGVQITNDGMPVVLLKERQSTGGYPMIGVVATRDLFDLVQAFPGTRVKFEWADVRRSRNELIRFYRAFGILPPAARF